MADGAGMIRHAAGSAMAGDALEVALVDGSAAGWIAAGVELRRHISAEGRAILLGVLLEIADPDDAARMVDGWFGAAQAGWIDLRDPLDDVQPGGMREFADGWAAMATETEVKVMILACFRHLGARDRVRFLGAAQKEALRQ